MSTLLEMAHQGPDVLSLCFCCALWLSLEGVIPRHSESGQGRMSYLSVASRQTGKRKRLNHAGLKRQASIDKTIHTAKIQRRTSWQVHLAVLPHSAAIRHGASQEVDWLQPRHRSHPPKHQRQRISRLRSHPPLSEYLRRLTGSLVPSASCCPHILACRSRQQTRPHLSAHSAKHTKSVMR